MFSPAAVVAVVTELLVAKEAALLTELTTDAVSSSAVVVVVAAAAAALALAAWKHFLQVGSLPSYEVLKFLLQLEHVAVFFTTEAVLAGP